ERERLVNAEASHRDERGRIDVAEDLIVELRQQPLDVVFPVLRHIDTVDQRVSPCLMKPRQSWSSTKSPPRKRVGFTHDVVRRGQRPSLDDEPRKSTNS